MKFLNFDLPQSVTLSGLGRVWDLHNHADFASVEVIPEENAVRLRWTMLPEFRRQGPEGEPIACVLRFDAVTSLTISLAGSTSRRANARTIDSIHRVVPREMTPVDALRQGARIRASGDDGNLLFTFMDGFDIEVAAASVGLEAVREAHG